MQHESMQGKISDMALRGIRVIEMAGLAPAPFCGMVLSDFGAKVIRIDRTKNPPDTDRLGRGKKSVAVDLKQKKGIEVVKKLCSGADVLIEPFRPGVMEKLGLGPETLMVDNPGLVYARLTGYGQKGSLSHRAGHDINYIATSGVLSTLGRKHENPCAPVNLLGDFAGGGLMCALGVVLALFERTRSGRGQVVDANMVQGSAYVSNFLWAMKDTFVWGAERGENLLDTGSPFYETYKTADGKFMSVGALEPQFYAALLKGLQLDPDKVSQYGDRKEMKKIFTDIFLSKTRDEWTEAFRDLDACVEPILDMDEAPLHPHNQTNNTFLKNPRGGYEAGPAPGLSRTPGVSTLEPQPVIGQHTLEVLQDAGYSQEDIRSLVDAGAVEQTSTSSKL
ncbi:alpha-methylacyl-CoA racemase-like isoform X2 [Haliotis rubra]|uniref:alpha-methylacyl-CoA racemase-like isoform X2 n=1 Tax=Haliotis rubra TaxID=36100 RepID=UPI001EE50643|nr:alpha-methylacyl-CoA racemase-like isoform X2 [Haliotis rubra]